MSFEPRGDRACPDCGSPRIVGHDEEGNAAWVCVSQCPPIVFSAAGVLTFDGDYVPRVDGASLTKAIADLDGKRVAIWVAVFGEPERAR